MKTYIFRYRFEGRWFTVDIDARDEAEAHERMRALPWAQYDGELVMRIPGFFGRKKPTRRPAVDA